MVKRGADEADLDVKDETKRLCPSSTDHLSRLSDELVLRVLSYLPVSQLVLCQRYVLDCLVYCIHTKDADFRTSTVLLREMASFGKNITTTAS